MATIIGVGLFGLPYIGARTGFFPLLLGFLVLTPIVIAIHLRFAYVVVGTKERDRIPGYVGRFIGGKWKWASLIVSTVGMAGSLLAYLIIGGKFLQLAVSPWFHVATLSATLLFFLAGMLLVLRGARSVARLDFTLMAIFFIIALYLFGMSVPHIVTENLSAMQWTALPLSYGVIVFSLWGLALVPETAELVNDSKPLTRAVIITAITASALFYILFVLFVLGVTGNATTPDALTGFLDVFGRTAVIPAALFGCIATFTSFVNNGLTLRQTLHFDLKMPRIIAWCVTAAVPGSLYLLGFQNFIEVIGITGAVLLGAEGVFVLATAEAFQRRRDRLHRMHWTSIVLFAVLMLGVVMELWTFWQRSSMRS